MDEKFISIPYETWNSKYKPMEKELEETKYQLEQEKRKKEIIIKVKKDRFWHGDNDYTLRDIGTIDIKFESGIDRELLDKIVKEVNEVAYSKVVGTDNYFGYVDREVKYLTIQEAYQLFSKLDIKKNIISQKIEENNSKISNLPWIVRWLFKIKKL